MSKSLDRSPPPAAAASALSQWWSRLVSIADERRTALMALRSRMLLLSLLLIAVSLALLVLGELLWGRSNQWMFLTGILVLLMGATFDYARTGKYRLYSQLLIGSLTLLVLALIIASGGQSRAPQICLPTIAVLAAMLLSRRATLIWATLMLAGLALSFHLRSTAAEVYLPLNPHWLESAVERMAAILVVTSVCIGIWCQGLIAKMHERLSRDANGLVEARGRCEIAEQRLEHYVDMASAWFWETDEQHRMVYLSAGFERSTGISASAALGLTPAQVMHLRYPNNTASDGIMRPMFERRGFKDQLLSWHEPLSGTLNHFANSAAPVYDKQGVFRGFRGRVINVSERNETVRQVRESVHGDFLTGLMSRRGMLESLDRALMRVRDSDTVGWWMQIDIDQFHDVNSRLNYAQGDIYLKRFARSLAEIAARPDALARMDGDGFGLLLMGTNKDEAAEVAITILGMARGLRMEFLGADAQGSASIGVTRFSTATAGVGAILQSADEACQQARKEGGAKAVFAGG
jgi:diguanylate cyclase (GGDEF)-like protein/PAS domain S-box-containing protein